MSLPRPLRNIFNLHDFEAPALRRLPRPLQEFAEIGVEDNKSRDANRAAFDDIWFRPRVLRGVTERSIERNLFGHTYDAPFGIAPMGASAMYGFEADICFARAAAQANIPFMMSGSAVIPMERVIAANSNIWFQAYVADSREDIKTLTDRAWSTGFRHMAVTVDVPVPGNRKDSLRAGFEYPMRPSASLAWQGLTHPRWMFKTFLRTLIKNGMPHIENYGAGQGIPMISRRAPQRKHVRAALNWDDLKWLRDEWQGKLLIKGVLSPADARIAADIGLDGLFVSNHGGRQLDGSLPPLKALPDIVAEKGKMAILFDGGVRRGSDIIKALALGADFVFIGRPFLYAAAIAEQAGVDYAIDLLSGEIDRNIALLGCTDLDDLESRIVM